MDIDHWRSIQRMLKTTVIVMITAMIIWKSFTLDMNLLCFGIFSSNFTSRDCFGLSWLLLLTKSLMLPDLSVSALYEVNFY